MVARLSSYDGFFPAPELPQEIGALVHAHKIFIVRRPVIIRKNDLVELFGTRSVQVHKSGSH
jgi:hypothetical protein